MPKSANSGNKSQPVYVIAGKETPLVNAQTDRLLDRLIDSEQRKSSLFDADPEKVQLSEVLDELRTLPFLSDQRVVIIKQADKFVSKHREALERYFDNPSSTAILILTVQTWDARTKLAKKLPKVGKLLDIKPPKGGKLIGLLIAYAADKHDKSISRSVVCLLIEIAGDNLIPLYNELDKLSLYVGDEKAITQKHVESLVGHNRLDNAFSVIDAVIASRPGQAVERLRNMFAMDKSTEFTVVGAFAYHIRRMFEAKALMDKGVNSAQIAGKLRVWNNKDAFFGQLRKLTLKQIGSILQQLARTDYMIKTGRTTARVAVEQLVLRLSSR